LLAIPILYCYKVPEAGSMADGGEYEL